MAIMYLKDPNPDVALLKQTMAERLLKLPRFSSVFVLQEKKVYVKAIPKEEIDLDYHITSKDGKGTFDDQDLDDLITETSNNWWDASDKPLWQFEIITNCKDNRSMIFAKADHAIGDGRTMIAVLESLFDGSFAPESVSSKKKSSLSKKIRWSQRVASFLHGIYYGFIGWGLEMNDTHNNLKIPRHIDPTEPCPKTFSQSKSFDFKDIQKIKNKMVGSTVNDVVVGSATIGIRRYFEKTNDPILKKIDKGTQLRAMAAVDMRPAKLSTKYLIENMGNDFCCTCFTLPLTYSDPIEVVWQIKDITEKMRLSPALHIIDNYCLEFLSKLLPEVFMAKATVDSVRKPTVVFSNVKGPPHEITLAGYPLEDLSFVNSSPVGVYVGFLSYNKKIRVAVTSQDTANIDKRLFIQCIEEGFEELKKAVENDPNDIIEAPDLTSLPAKILETIAVPLAVTLIASGSYLFAKRN